jgi:hypothetical protein
MLVTITNVTNLTDPPSRTINDLDVLTGGSGPSALYAVGGARKDPLPYPFAHIGALAVGGGAAKQLPSHERDMRYKMCPSEPLEAGEEWNQLVQKGTVTFAVANEVSTSRDVGDLFIGAI